MIKPLFYDKLFYQYKKSACKKQGQERKFLSKKKPHIFA
jgi:hypothetical protein